MQFPDASKIKAGRLYQAIVILVLFLASTVGCGTYRIAQDWELPTGYRGWVLVEWANPKCPSARVTLMSVIVKVDSSGHGCISTPVPKGSQFLRFYELDSSGNRHKLRMGYRGNGQIWEYSNGDEASENELPSFYGTEFFVGSEAEWRSSQKTRPKWWLSITPQGSVSQ